MSTDTRSNILAAARRLFNTQGYDRVTMRRIASEAGIGVGNVTYYFPRKQDIVASLMDDSFEQTRTGVPVTGPAQLTQMFSRMLDTLERNSFFFLDPAFENDEHHTTHHRQLRGDLSAAMTALTERGLCLSGLSPDGRLVEIVENPANDWFVGVQFHPEFKSRPNRAHPLFADFIAAALARQAL